MRLPTQPRASDILKSSVICLLIALCLPCPAAPQDATTRSFLSGSTGALPGDPSLLARTYFDEGSVRELIYAMETSGVSVERATELLQGSGVTLEDLFRVQLVREEGGRLFIAFNYFTADDMASIRRVADERVPSLVDDYVDRADEFRAIFDAYPAKSVAPSKIALALIAGMSLNWDGLAFAEEQGYRVPNLVEGADWGYSFWASEEVAAQTTRGFLWGSSTFPAPSDDYDLDYAFSSFGDPYSDPRMNFPDLLGTPPGAMQPRVREIAERIGLVNEIVLDHELRNVLGFGLGRDIGSILFSLRRGNQTQSELGFVVGDVDRLPALLALLVETQYVDVERTGTYSLLVPILDYDDRPMVQSALELSRRILGRWFEENYESMKADLADLTSMRHGVPFESLFTQIWHELFGLATRELVASGLIADTYSAETTYKGSLGTVWRHALFDFDPR